MYGILNGFVHVLMYIYYFLTILQPDSRDYYARFKPRITEIQLVHIIGEFKHVSQSIKNPFIADAVCHNDSALPP